MKSGVQIFLTKRAYKYYLKNGQTSFLQNNISFVIRRSKRFECAYLLREDKDNPDKYNFVCLVDEPIGLDDDE